MSWRCTALIEPLIRHISIRLTCEQAIMSFRIVPTCSLYSKMIFFVLVIAGVVRHVAVTDTKIAEETTADEEMKVDDIMMIDVALTRLLLLRSSIPEKTIFR